MSAIGYQWFKVRIWCRGLPDRLSWRLAWLVPRKVALYCFVRVCGATGDDPGNITYDSAYRAYDAGAGK